MIYLAAHHEPDPTLNYVTINGDMAFFSNRLGDQVSNLYVFSQYVYYRRLAELRAAQVAELSARIGHMWPGRELLEVTDESIAEYR